jgi:putative ABC transport system permease protein
MSAGDILFYAFGSVKRRKLRTGMTSLGVAIGIAAIVSLLAITQGLQGSVANELRSGLETDTLIVTPVSNAHTPLYITDYVTIEALDNVSKAVPVVQGIGYLKNGNSTIAVTVVGVDLAKYRAIYNNAFIAQQGTIPVEPTSDTIIIGARVNDPGDNGTVVAGLGDQVQVGRPDPNHRGVNISYDGRIAAVLEEVGPLGMGGLSDAAIYVPIEKAESLFSTTTCSMIVVELQSDGRATIASSSTAITESLHGQVQVSSSQQLSNVVSRVFTTINLFLIGIGGIALLVAGIGIMNVMMISMLERTREIGTLKALGMKNRTVLAIFLCEASFIGVIGGVLGAIGGYLLAKVIAGFLNQSLLFSEIGGSAFGNMTIVPVLDLTIFFSAIAFGLLVSVVFALYPAWRSSRLSPVEALSRE